MKILITGAAGFIGFLTVKSLLNDESAEVVGLDNINDYYSPQLKYARLEELGINQEDITLSGII
jgi:UDP-glucuronate 4-epimerase